jgi:LmbE family N-acetylglucosaminyl deacetylase
VRELIRKIGRAEAEWQSARTLSDVRLTSARSLIGAAGRLVIVAPHPDDEVLGAGGLTVEARRLGLDVHLLAVTDGENSHRGSKARSRAHLRFQRIREAEKAFAILGGNSSHISRLRFSDGHVANAKGALMNELSGRLQAGDLVATTWLHDGHPDHNTCGAAVSALARNLNIAVLFFPVWMWNWASPRQRTIPWHRMVRMPLRATTRIKKRQALACFESQRSTDPDVADTPILSDATLEYFDRGFEAFFVCD